MTIQFNADFDRIVVLLSLAIGALLSACSPNFPDHDSRGEVKFMTRERDVSIVVGGDLAAALTQAFLDYRRAQGSRTDRLYGRPWGVFVQGAVTLAWSEDRVFGLIEGEKRYWTKRVPELSALAKVYEDLNHGSQIRMNSNDWHRVFGSVQAEGR